MFVKICGINSESAFDTAVEAGADAIGLNFFPGSPRYVTPRQAAALTARHQDGPIRYGLFVNPPADQLRQVLETVPLDRLQIYGDPALAQALRTEFKLEICRAIGIETAADLPDMAADADGLLIESKPPDGATRPGGNAAVFDWAVLKNWRAPKPWMLAGGLNAENVAAAIKASGAKAVDVSSGVESLPGVKSPALIRRFILNARNARPRAE